MSIPIVSSSLGAYEWISTTPTKIKHAFALLPTNMEPDMRVPEDNFPCKGTPCQAGFMLTAGRVTTFLVGRLVCRAQLWFLRLLPSQDLVDYSPAGDL